jgi:hypothetical protein
MNYSIESSCPCLDGLTGTFQALGNGGEVTSWGEDGHHLASPQCDCREGGCLGLPDTFNKSTFSMTIRCDSGGFSLLAQTFGGNNRMCEGGSWVCQMSANASWVCCDTSMPLPLEPIGIDGQACDSFSYTFEGFMMKPDSFFNRNTCGCPCAQGSSISVTVTNI